MIYAEVDKAVSHHLGMLLRNIVFDWQALWVVHPHVCSKLVQDPAPKVNLVSTSPYSNLEAKQSYRHTPVSTYMRMLLSSSPCKLERKKSRIRCQSQRAVEHQNLEGAVYAVFFEA